MLIEKIIEHKDVVTYIITRGLLKQYKKQKKMLLRGRFMDVNFKKRRPFSEDVWYFRINKKYRAYAFFWG